MQVAIIMEQKYKRIGAPDLYTQIPADVFWTGVTIPSRK